MEKKEEAETSNEKLKLKNALKIGVPIFLLASYVKYLMDNYKINLKEPPEDSELSEKSQEQIITMIEEILNSGDSIVGCLFPHTSLADHIVFNRELLRWSKYKTAWVATKKFITGKMGLAGLFAQAWLHIDNKVKMFWVTQAYIRDKMTREEAAIAKGDNVTTVNKAIEFLKKGKSVLFFYPEGTRVKKTKEKGSSIKRSKLARAHPGAFNTAAEAAKGDKKIYLAPMYVGEVPDGKIRAFLPATTEITYGEPIEVGELKNKFDQLKGKIKFTEKAMDYHHYKNPSKKRLIKSGVKQVDQEGNKLYIDKPAEFGFADFVMWNFAQLMPKEKRGIYGDDCVTIDTK